MSKYTFEEVQEVIKELRCISLQGTCDIEAEMLTEYAERIKADEGAVGSEWPYIEIVTLAWSKLRERDCLPEEWHEGDMVRALQAVWPKPPAQPTKLEDGMREVDVALVERLRNHAAQEREIAKNSARVAELLAPELVLFKAREGHYNIYATRMAIDHRDSAKKDAAFADDLETAADKLTAALRENAK